jgi:hypothetical protein
MINCMFSENVLSSLEIIFEPRDGRHWERSFDQAFVLASRDLASHQLVLLIYILATHIRNRVVVILGYTYANVRRNYAPHLIQTTRVPPIAGPCKAVKSD